MSDDDEAKKALIALAKLEGKDPAELMRELLRERVGSQLGAKSAALTRRDEPEDDLDFPGTPESLTTRSADESPDEAMERWLQEESVLPGGVHSPEGMEGGGIFGPGPVASQVYDPNAAMRADARQAHANNAQMTVILAAIGERMGLPPATDGAVPTRQLPAARQALMGRRKRRRRSR